MVANRKPRHEGVICTTKRRGKPPEVFYGSIAEIGRHLGTSYRSAWNIIEVGTKTRKNWRAMTPEEFEEHYQPPKEYVYSGKKVNLMANWRITFFKDWKPGDAYPDPKTETERRWSGNPTDFARFAGVPVSTAYNMVKTHRREPTLILVHSAKKWRIARIREHSKAVPHRKVKQATAP
ncbi:MAG: hypothetical protein HRT61_09920 [Ekhidna sp.]|nr:hypothetical protein [Ekhidna sp.]